MNYQKIKTFEDACAALKIDANALPDFSMLPEKYRNALLAHYKLLIVIEAINEGWKPNWADTNERKYTPWFSVSEEDSKPSGFGLSFGGYDVWYSYTFVGSRLFYPDIERAKHVFENFKNLYEEYMLIS